MLIISEHKEDGYIEVSDAVLVNHLQKLGYRPVAKWRKMMYFIKNADISKAIQNYNGVETSGKIEK